MRCLHLSIGHLPRRHDSFPSPPVRPHSPPTNCETMAPYGEGSKRDKGQQKKALENKKKVQENPVAQGPTVVAAAAAVTFRFLRRRPLQHRAVHVVVGFSPPLPRMDLLHTHVRLLLFHSCSSPLTYLLSTKPFTPRLTLLLLLLFFCSLFAIFYFSFLPHPPRHPSCPHPSCPHPPSPLRPPFSHRHHSHATRRRAKLPSRDGTQGPCRKQNHICPPLSPTSLREDAVLAYRIGIVVGYRHLSY